MQLRSLHNVYIYQIRAVWLSTNTIHNFDISVSIGQIAQSVSSKLLWKTKRACCRLCIFVANKSDSKALNVSSWAEAQGYMWVKSLNAKAHDLFDMYCYVTLSC